MACNGSTLIEKDFSYGKQIDFVIYLFQLTQKRKRRNELLILISRCFCFPAPLCLDSIRYSLWRMLAFGQMVEQQFGRCTGGSTYHSLYHVKLTIITS